MNKYSSYKDSGVEWIGEIPVHWTSKGLRFSINVYKGKIPKNLTETKEADMLPYLSMEILRGGDPKEFSYDDDGLAVKKGDIGILWDGSNSGEIILINQDGLMSSTVSKLDIIDDNLNKAFTYYLLKYYEKDFKDNTIGMGIPHMDGNHLKFSKLVCPSLTEQQQIVSFLDDKTTKIDNLIRHKEKKIELLKEKCTALINHVVTKGLNPDVEMKDSGIVWIGEIPRQWKHSNLNHYLVGIKDGTHGSFKTVDTGEPLLSAKNIQNGKLIIGNDERQISRTDYESIIKNGFPRKDDVILVVVGATIGKCTLYDHDKQYAFQRSVGFLRAKDTLDSHYLKYLVESDLFQEQLTYSTNVAAIGGVYLGEIKKIKITIPPLDEQQQIVDYLDEQTKEIDDLIQLEQQKIELLKEYRQSLISEVVTGKVRVCEEDLSTKQINQA